MVSKKQTGDIALAHVQDRGFSVRSILAGEELGSPPTIYTAAPIDWMKVWVVYLAGPTFGFALKSSDIVVVAKDDGRVLYSGSANDEEGEGYGTPRASDDAPGCPEDGGGRWLTTTPTKGCPQRCIGTTKACCMAWACGVNACCGSSVSISLWGLCR